MEKQTKITITSGNYYHRMYHSDFDGLTEITIIDGDLSMCSYDIEKLPKNIILNVVGGIIISSWENNDDRITRLPKNTTITGEVFFKGNYYSLAEYRTLIGHKIKQKIIFSRKNKNIIKKLLYIPELYQDVFYDNKSIFISLLQKT